MLAHPLSVQRLELSDFGFIDNRHKIRFDQRRGQITSAVLFRFRPTCSDLCGSLSDLIEGGVCPACRQNLILLVSETTRTRLYSILPFFRQGKHHGLLADRCQDIDPLVNLPQL